MAAAQQFLTVFLFAVRRIWIDYSNSLALLHQRTESTLQDILKRLQMRLETRMNPIAERLTGWKPMKCFCILLEKYQLPPRFLELELTERIAIHNVEAAIEISRQLSNLGVEISIDDFGTGYSSLSYLQRFSLNKLKIDQSFTRRMTDNKESENIVDAIISLAKSLKMKTIAEGVETEQQLSMYKQKGCDEIQGFYFSKPVPAEEFTELLKRYR
jgi:sensor c-di-GMP phosphodiesterase-like protein